MRETSTYPDELELLDLTIKKFTRPQLALNTAILAERKAELSAEREDLLQHLGVEKGELTSDAKFAELLVSAGVPRDELPMKWSAKQKKMVYAFSKNDPGLKKLGYDLRWALLVKARLLFKSTQEETRLKRLEDVANASIWAFGQPLLAVPIKYYGAHTGRFSGLDKLNMQNLGRKSLLRKAIEGIADDEVILAGDLSQIEARLVATVAEQWDLVDQFARGEDVYALFATDHYGYHVHKDTHPQERFVGKTGILSLGFQSGAAKFHATMNDVFNTPITEREAARVVETYRTKYRKIVELWKTMENLIFSMSRGIVTKVKPIRTGKNHIVLPNGMRLQYPGLRRSDGRWVYSDPETGGTTDLYGGKLLENIIQALARIVVTTAELRLARHGLRAALSVHDELVFVVKREHAPLIRKIVQKVMSYPVEWLLDLPVEAEVKFGNTYGDVK